MTQVAPTAPETPEELIRISSNLSLPRRTLTDYNIGQLAEFKTVPDGAIIEKSVTPLLSPYNLYRRQNSFPAGIQSIRQLLRMNSKLLLRSVFRLLLLINVMCHIRKKNNMSPSTLCLK
jgi:hypothetical protein